MPRRRPPNLVGLELTHHFLRADTVQGMASSWAPLVGLAMGGFGGSADPERRITDRRFGWPGRELGDHGPTETEIAAVRKIRDALRALPPTAGAPSWYDVLYATYGSLPWEKILDEGGGVGTALKVTGFIEPRLLGVALFTEEARRGLETDRRIAASIARAGTLVTHRSPNLDKPFANEELFYAGKTVDAWRRGRRNPQETDPTLRGTGPWIIGLCLVASMPGSMGKASRARRKAAEEKAKAAAARLGIVQGQALQLLAAAEAAYRAARGILPPAEPDAAEAAAVPAPPRRRRGPNRPKELPIGGAG